MGHFLCALIVGQDMKLIISVRLPVATFLVIRELVQMTHSLSKRRVYKFLNDRIGFPQLQWV